MTFFSKDISISTKPAASRRQYLQNLLQQATARMRQDEEAVAVSTTPTPRPVSRRETMRWLGIAAFAAASGARPLRALADGITPSGILHERAAISGGSPRYPAPQYGAPALPLPHEPYVHEDTPAPKPLADPVQTAQTREDLADPKKWTANHVILLSDSQTITGLQRLDNAPSTRVIYYRGAWPKAHAIEVTQSAYTKTFYVVPGGQSFYVEHDGDLLAFLHKGNTLYINKSFYHQNGPNASVDDTIRSFAKHVPDAKLLAYEKDTITITLKRTGAPVSSDDTSLATLISGVHVDDGKVTIFSYATDTFTIDLNTKKLLTSESQ